MRGDIYIGRVARIPLYLNVSFLLLPALVAWLTYDATGSAAAALWVAASMLILFACVVLHELGHCVVAQRLGARVVGITLLPIGGVASMSNLPERPLHEIAVAIAGPLVNVLIFALLLPFVNLQQALSGWATLPESAAALPASLLRANMVLVLFNLIPAFPMDGGRVLRALLAYRMSFPAATVFAARIGRLVAVLFVLAGLRYSPMLALVGVFIFISAGQESDFVAVRGKWKSFMALHAMRPPRVLSPASTLEEALARWHVEGQGDYVVCDGERVVGLLPLGLLCDALRRGRLGQRVSSAMQRHFVAVEANSDAGQVFADLGRTGQRLVPVLQAGRLIGMIDLHPMAAAGPQANGSVAGVTTGIPHIHSLA